jgi:hypothetical protein
MLKKIQGNSEMKTYETLKRDWEMKLLDIQNRKNVEHIVQKIEGIMI